MNLPIVTDKGEVKLEPKTLLDHCWVKQGGKFLEESLVKWKHLPLEEATQRGTIFIAQTQFGNNSQSHKTDSI